MIHLYSRDIQPLGLDTIQGAGVGGHLGYHIVATVAKHPQRRVECRSRRARQATFPVTIQRLMDELYMLRNETEKLRRAGSVSIVQGHP